MKEKLSGLLQKGRWPPKIPERIYTEFFIINFPLNLLRMKYSKALPFGIKTAPACYKRIVNSVITGLIGSSVFLYLDDVIIYGKELQLHVENLKKVLDRLPEAKLTLK